MPLNLVRNFPENEVRHEYVPSKIDTNDPADKDKRPIPPVRQRPHQLLRWILRNIYGILTIILVKKDWKRFDQKMNVMKMLDRSLFQIVSRYNFCRHFVTKIIIQPTCDEVFSEGPLMTRICSQLTNSKLPLQGQKNVDVKEEKNDEKNLYRDISMFRNSRKSRNFRIVEIFGESIFSMKQPWTVF